MPFYTPQIVVLKGLTVSLNRLVAQPKVIL